MGRERKGKTINWCKWEENGKVKQIVITTNVLLFYCKYDTGWTSNKEFAYASLREGKTHNMCDCDMT